MLDTEEVCELRDFFLAAFLRAMGCLDQAIGHSTHRRDHHDDCALAARGGNNLGRALDTLGIPHRRAPKFHHPQRSSHIVSA